MIKPNLVILIIPLLVFSISVGSSANVEPEAATTMALLVNAESPAGKTVSAFHHAIKSNDPETARFLLSDDVLIFEGGVERSADEYASHHMLADMKYLATVESKVLEHRVDVVKDLAVSIMRSKVTGNYADKNIDYESLETMTLREINGQWKITHVHWSH